MIYRPRWWMVLASSVLLAGFYFTTLRRVGTLPVTLEPFVKSLSFTRHGDGVAIAEVVDLPFKSGFYAELTFIPGASIPSEVDGLTVEDPEIWPVVLRIYPREDTTPSRSYDLRFIRYKRARTRRSLPLPSSVPKGAVGYWQPDVGYRGELKPPKSWAKNEQRLWTFFTTKPGDTGEFTYEIVVFPTAKWVSSVRSQSGAPIVVRRGILKVH